MVKAQTGALDPAEGRLTGTPFHRLLTLLGPQPRFGDNPVKFQVVCPQNGTAVVKGLTLLALGAPWGIIDGYSDHHYVTGG